mmetsp:Transcript_14305/g.43986  ORF Transcript_14305/g.43986 Transcript_14305/m.43986 type:complete len:90 (-) Transcript_14305:117-386(-)
MNGRGTIFSAPRASTTSLSFSHGWYTWKMFLLSFSVSLMVESCENCRYFLSHSNGRCVLCARAGLQLICQVVAMPEGHARATHGRRLCL